MPTTKGKRVRSLAGLLIAALFLQAGASDGRENTQRNSQKPTVDATSAVAGAVDVKAEPDQVRMAFERLSEKEMKDLYLRCNEEALASRLAKAEIALCSIGYDVLLKQHFHGEFGALLAWSKGL